MYQREQDKPAVSLLLNWFRQLAEHGRVPAEDYAQLDYVYRSEEEVRTMLAATLERERKQIYQAGKKEGRIESQRQMISQLLQFRFELGETEQQGYVQQVARLQDPQGLDELVNVLLDKATKLEDFIKLLTKYLPDKKIV